MGLGGPLGGFIADRFAVSLSPLAKLIHTFPQFRLGWRWAFLIQLPLFLVSFLLTSINLHYVTPVRITVHMVWGVLLILECRVEARAPRKSSSVSTTVEARHFLFLYVFLSQNLSPLAHS